MSDKIGLRSTRPLMGTEFELLLCGEDEVFLRAAAEEALDAAGELERQLSRFIPTSELSGINERAYTEAVRTEPGLFCLLLNAARIARWTGGAFDPTVAPLVECWGFYSGRPVGSGKGRRQSVPTSAQLAAARERVGIGNVLLDESNRTVRFLREGMALDLGGIAKGYAVDRIAEILRGRGIRSALIHAGTSTVYAIGSPPQGRGEGRGWVVGVAHPFEPGRRLAVVCLKDRALSVSNASARYFVKDGISYGHVINPGTGRPAVGLITAAAACESATDSDALATALFAMGVDDATAFRDGHPQVETLLAALEAEPIRIGSDEEVLQHVP